MTPQKTHATERAIHEYRCASYEYICRHFKARLNHIVLRLTTTLKGDFACDPVLRCVYPFDDQMRACGLLDWSPHGSFQYALESEREASHRVFNIAVGGVTPLAWPAASFLGHVLYICIVADLVWEGWEEPGGGGALERWLETRAAAPDATVEERRAHDAYKRGTLSRWLDRQPSDFNYDLREFADYEAIRAQAMAPAGSEAEKEQLSAAARVGVRQEVRVTRFRLRAESWPRTFFGDPSCPGSAGSNTPEERLGLKIGRGMSEVLIAGWTIGNTMQRGANVATGTKRARTMPAWGSAAENDRVAVYRHDHLVVQLDWGHLHMPFDWKRFARVRLWMAFYVLKLVRRIVERRRQRSPAPTAVQGSA